MPIGDLKTENTELERFTRGWTATVIYSPKRNFRSRAYRLSEHKIVLSRDPRDTYSAIAIEDPTVSRDAVSLRLVNDHYELYDEGSHNPVRVNGQAVTRHTLKANDVIRLGNTLIVIERDDPARHTRSRTTNAQRIDQLLERLHLKLSTGAALVRLEGSIIEPDLRSLVVWTPGVIESRQVGEWLAQAWDQELTIVDANAEGALDDIKACPADHALLVDRLDLAPHGSIPRIAREIERRFSNNNPSLTITSLDRSLRHKSTPYLDQAVALICHFDLAIPPLKERRADILQAMLHHIALSETSMPPVNLTADIGEYFLLYDWPQGLAELQRYSAQLKSMLKRGEISLSLIPSAIRDQVKIDAGELSPPLNAERVRDALLEHGNMKEVAASFGYSRTYFYRLLAKEGIDVQGLRQSLKLKDDDDA